MPAFMGIQRPRELRDRYLAESLVASLAATIVMESVGVVDLSLTVHKAILGVRLHYVFARSPTVAGHSNAGGMRPHPAAGTPGWSAGNSGWLHSPGH